MPRKFSLGYKIIWGVASLGLSLIAGIYGALLPIFYQDYLGLGAGWIALASLIYGIWNALNDPLFGFISDSTTSKHGRRIPYMRWTAPFLALSFIAVWFAPRGAAQVWIFVWMLVSMIFYDACYTIIGLVYSALLPEVTEDEGERNHLQISYSLFAMVGMALGFVIPDMFRPKAGGSVSFGPLQTAMIAVGAVGALLIVVTTLKVKERPEFTRVDKPLPLGAQIKATFTSKSFLILVASNFMSILVSALVIGSLFYLADYVTKTSTMVLLVCLFVPLIVGVPMTNVIRGKLGLLKTQQLLMAIAGVGLVGIAFVPASLIPVCLVLAGFGLAGPQTLTNIFFAQVADEDELESGVRREGAFFGINALVTKPAQSIAIALAPAILAATHFVTREANGGAMMADQPAAAIFGIKVFSGLIPGLAMFAGAAILQAFPIKGERLEKMGTELLALHEEKSRKLAEKANP
jgi:GPH family glycoside/pentoside/hexuronide:cation symporter